MFLMWLNSSQMEWHTPIPALEKLKYEDHKSEAELQ